MARWASQPRSKRNERGAALVEFALIALVLYLMLAATVDLGRMIFTAQALQDAARVASKELSVLPLPAAIPFDDALNRCDVWQRVFNPAQLVIDLDTFATDDALDAFLASLPPVNQALRPLMIVDHVTIDMLPRNFLRYPGALLDAPPPAPPGCALPAASGFGVGIPRVTARNATGVETIEWVPILAEVRTDPAVQTTGSFSIASGGLVALMVNYPFQAAMMTSFRPTPPTGDDPLPPDLANYNVADDGNVAHDPADPYPPPTGNRLDPGQPTGVYAGPYGLGRQFAFAGKTVRPYRKLITAQAIYRREVME
jgi:Flp pilus assembly pilin Flp